ncbi:MAG: hypothetical protein KAS04_06995, partial [Candidatus Aenigmarchaeota archaeon]|nr:hypothetical protein [Candidatus Aenigmarchaeota archaeon]
NDIELMVKSLEKEFLAGEKQRWKEVQKSIKDIMVAKGEAEGKLDEFDKEMGKFTKAKTSMKTDIVKESISLIDDRFSSLSTVVKDDLSAAKKSMRQEMTELKDASLRLDEKLMKINEKIVGVKDQIFSVKRSRDLWMSNVESMNNTLENNIDAKIRNFSKDNDKRMRNQEKIIMNRLSDVEKKIGDVSGHVTKTKKEKEEELDDLLKHVES